MTMGPRDPSRTARLDQLGPGRLCLLPGRDGPDLALIVLRAERPEALLMNRRSPAGGDLPLVSDLVPEGEALILRGAFLAPTGAPVSAVGARIPAALHLAEDGAYLCGRDASGTLAAFAVATGRVGTIDPAALPQVPHWRVLIPRKVGVATVYATEPA
jgi:hypothetical protein